MENKTIVKILDFDFNLEKIREDVDKLNNRYLPKLRLMKNWQGVPLRNGVNSVSHDGLELSKSVDYTNFKIMPCYDTEIMDHVPYIREVIDKISKQFDTYVGLVRVLKIPAHQKIQKHQDGLMFNFDKIGVYRLHLPVYSNDKTVFMIDDKNYYLEPKHLYFTDVSYDHSVTNSSDVDRIHIVIDIQATKTVHEMFKSYPELEPMK